MSTPTRRKSTRGRYRVVLTGTSTSAGRTTGSVRRRAGTTAAALTMHSNTTPYRVALSCL